jgi:DNA-binding response OmpR family regulator
MLNVVVVEDHRALREMLVVLLRAAGHTVSGVESAEPLSDETALTTLDVAIVDLQLPGEHGLSLIARLRKAQPSVAIIAMTALSGTNHRVAGYDSGADLYLVKPVDPQELLAAVNRSGQRVLAARVAASRLDGLQLDTLRMRIIGPSGETRMTAGEGKLLATLARAPQQRLESWQILEILGIEDASDEKHRLAVRMGRLRKKLLQVGAAPDCLQAIHKAGYQLCVPLEIR